MPQEIINRGTPNNKNGDTYYDAFGKVINNFSELYQNVANLSGASGTFTDITWADLVIAEGASSTDTGQKYNITTLNPSDGMVYGKVTLVSPNSFFFEETSIVTRTIIIG